MRLENLLETIRSLDPAIIAGRHTTRNPHGHPPDAWRQEVATSVRAWIRPEVGGPRVIPIKTGRSELVPPGSEGMLGPAAPSEE